MNTIKIGTGLPTVSNDPGVPETLSVTEAARQIEKRGFESLWIPDLIIGDGTPTLEAALTLSAAAAVTTRVKIGFSVLVVPLRPAPWLAQQVATLQHLSGNRLLLGVGSGGFPGAPFWQALGVEGTGRGRVTDETLRLLPQLLSGNPVRLADQAAPLTLAPSAPMPPVIVGGSERSFGRVLELGDGWFPSLLSPTALGPAVDRLHTRAAAQGRPKPSITVGGHMIMGTGTDAEAAYDSLVRSLVTAHGMTPEAAQATPMRARNPEELAEIFHAYQEAGADRVVTGADNGEWEAQLDFLAEAKAMLS